MKPLVLPSILGDSLAELNRLRREADAATGIPTRLLYRDPPLHPTETEHIAEARARFRRQNARLEAERRSEADER
jgi:hypothetical protein